MIESEGFILFFSSLLVCVPIATFYKQIEDVERKRNFGTGICLLMALLICGPHIYYTIILVWGNIIIFRSCHKRMVHQISMLYTWLFLLYLHFNVVCTKYARWLCQNLALRLVGLAFEMHICYKATDRTDVRRPSSTPEVCDERALCAIIRLSAADIVNYAYFFIGLHKGPYYTWKTFNDHFHSPISVRGNFRMVTEQKLKKAFLFTLGYLLMRSKYPLSMYEKNEFYANYGTDYRFLSSLPQIVLYFLEFQIISMVSTSVCSEAGFGVYPARCLAVPGAGPTVPVKLTGEEPDNEDYNFSMLKCFDNEKLLLGPKMKDTIRGWDMATRYWFSQYIMKDLIKANFEVRSACSFLFWAIWAGPTVQNNIIALTLWVYIHLESEYAQLYAETLKGPWDLGFAIMRIFCLFYLTPCYIIEDKKIALRYYSSIYWMYHIVLGILTVVAIGIHRNRSLNVIRQDTQKPTRDQRRPSAISTDHNASANVSSTGNNEAKRRQSETGSIRGRSGTSDQDSKPSTSGNNTNTNNNAK